MDMRAAVCRALTCPSSCPMSPASSASLSSSARMPRVMAMLPPGKGVGIDIGRVHHIEVIGHVGTMRAPGQGHAHAGHVGVQGRVLGHAIVRGKLVGGVDPVYLDLFALCP